MFDLKKVYGVLTKLWAVDNYCKLCINLDFNNNTTTFELLCFFDSKNRCSFETETADKNDLETSFYTNRYTSLNTQIEHTMKNLIT